MTAFCHTIFCHKMGLLLNLHRTPENYQNTALHQCEYRKADEEHFAPLHRFNQSVPVPRGRTRCGHRVSDIEYENEQVHALADA